MSEQIQNDFQIENDTLIKYVGKEKIVVVPGYVHHIAPYAFFNSPDVEIVETPIQLLSLGRGAFTSCPKLKEVIVPGVLYKRIVKDEIFDDIKKIYFRFYATTEGDALSEDSAYIAPPVSRDITNPSIGDEMPTEKAKGEGLGDEPDERYSRLVITDQQMVEEETPISDDEDQVPEEAGGDEDYGGSTTLKERIDAVVPVEMVEDVLPDVKKHVLIDLNDFLIEESTLVKYVGSKKEVVVPEFITEIGENAFSNSKVTKVTLPDGVVLIGKGAFTWCEELQEINLPEGLQIIDESAFSECPSLTEAVIPEGVRFIGANAYHACSGIKNLQLPSTIFTVGRRAFDFCVSLEEVVVPEGITELLDGAFAHCEGLKKVVLPEGLTEIGDWQFSECASLTEVVLPSTLKRIGDVAFMNCSSLTELNIPMSVEQLGKQAFVGCKSLNVVRMPKQLEKQVKPSKAFHGVKKVKFFYV